MTERHPGNESEPAFAPHTPVRVQLQYYDEGTWTNVPHQEGVFSGIVMEPAKGSSHLVAEGTQDKPSPSILIMPDRPLPPRADQFATCHPYRLGLGPFKEELPGGGLVELRYYVSRLALDNS